MRKCTSTKKAHVHSLFITFDVLWMYVVTKKVGFYEQYFVFWFIQILTFCKSLAYRHFCEKLGWQMWLNFPQVTKNFAGLFFRERLPLIPKSISAGEYQYQCTCCFILIFHISLNMLYMRQQNLHKQPVHCNMP